MIVFVREALYSLKNFNVEKKAWNQKHQSSNWIIVNFLLNNQINGQEVMNLLINYEKKTYKIVVNQ